MAVDQIATRRRYSKVMKAQVIAECEQPGASVAKVAMSHGINANVVHGWRKLARGASGAAESHPREFVPVALQAAVVPHAGERGIEVEVRRGAMAMKITWPLSAAADFAAWTCELLR
jgi:transposase